jgi:hypothetical protein
VFPTCYFSYFNGSFGMSRHEVRVFSDVYAELESDMRSSPRFHLPQVFKMFSTPPQCPRTPTQTPIKLSVPLPRTSSTIRPVSLYAYFLRAALVPLVAYGLYSTFGNVLSPSRPRAGPSSTQARRGDFEP